MNANRCPSEIFKRVGITSWAFHHMDVFELIELLARHEFGLEIHLNDFDYEIGDPKPWVQSGVWPRTCVGEQRQRLCEAVKQLPMVTVHGTPFDLNITANNPGIREESICQYEEAMDLARDVGAVACTYHEGRGSSQLTPLEVLVDRHVEFGRRIAARAQEYGIPTGLENGNDLSYYESIIGQVSSPYWGHLLDIGHAIMGVRGDTDTVKEWVAKLGAERIVEVHAHNVFASSAIAGGMLDHFPLEDGTCLDMEVVFGRLRDAGYAGPIVLEISVNTTEKVIDACLRARDAICRIWEQGEV